MARHKRVIVVVLLVLAVLFFIPASYGAAGLCALAAIGVGAFAGGAPQSVEDGSHRRSVWGSW